MGDVVNLNQFRKKQNQKKTQDTARNNRVSFGRSAVQKKQDKNQQKKQDASLDQKKLHNQGEDKNETPPEN
ncbi:DUF4169 family protein [Sneathiella litorea]|uniref:DUF4169 family protein n=1 Tax=Sneathiella litorea TaxID=2606216 RepID=A0A6L8W6Q3_9PROT|nr:DUF4169 family protein [Sneathiella litorea]MZR30154.1 DUF4169 family protein [Sneathiella litorea]